jgi:Helix-hairpin-helix motif
MKQLLCILLFPLVASAQTTEDASIELIAASQVINTETETENVGTFENYTQYLVHQADLNSAQPEQLRMFGLNETQVRNLGAHRALHGNLASIYELQTIDGFDTTLIRQLIRIVTVKDPAATLDQHFFRRVRSDGYTYALLRADIPLEQRKGFASSTPEDARFSGPTARYSFRFRSFRSGDFSFGITAENDPGEKIKWQPSSSQYGFDYIAIHAQIQNKGFIKNLIIGDYQAQFGQGLVWGGAMGVGKGAEAITNVRRSSIGFVPYTSAYESGSFHGAATTLGLNKHLHVNVLLSGAKKDATLNFRKGGEQVISSFQSSGLHRNERELAKRKVINQNVAGLVLEYNKPDLILGATYQYMDLDFPVEPARFLYNQFAFRGSQNSNGGVYVNYARHNVSFFSEAAATAGHGKALLVGSLVTLTPKFDISLLYRNYARNYIGLFSNAFSENTLPVNEKGFYWGWKYKLSRKYYFTGYLDFFRFPWLKYRTYAPSAGNEWLVHFHWQPAKTTTVFFQLRQESKMRNASDDNTTLYVLNKVKKNSFWLHAEHYLTKTIRLKSRIQWSSFYKGTAVTEGFAFAQDLAVTSGKAKFTMRYALFDTDDFDNAQYMYENDVWLTYSLPAYNGRGVRKYIMVQYKINKQFTCWLRYSHTRFLERESIGSGVDLIDGNQQNDVKFEIRIHL